MLWSTQYWWILSTLDKKLPELPYKLLILPRAIRIYKSSELLSQLFLCDSVGFIAFIWKVQTKSNVIEILDFFIIPLP